MMMMTMMMTAEKLAYGFFFGNLRRGIACGAGLWRRQRIVWFALCLCV